MNHLARIEWIPAEAGGRKAPPAGCRYSTVACFTTDSHASEQSAWSVVIESDRPLNKATSIIASVHFLAPDAPAHYLTTGQIFWLTEGVREVARCEILAQPELEFFDATASGLAT